LQVQLRAALNRLVPAIWIRRGFLAYALLPLSLLYIGITALRRHLYRVGIFESKRVNAVVIVVGNVVAGGAGKTPTVIEIVKFFQQRKIRVGVVSRGYGRKSSACEEVHPNASAYTSGDEPKLIQSVTGVPVFVAAQRYLGAVALLAKYPDIRVIVCDDGLQHYELCRDIEVCVFDDRGLGNGWLMPSGPLRENWPRNPVLEAGQLNDRLLILHTGQHPQFAGFRASRNLSGTLKRVDGVSISVAEFLKSNEKPLLAIAGIAQPEIFFRMLRMMGIPIVQTMALPDHSDFHELSLHKLENFQLICTEKDAYKLWETQPDALAIPLEQHSEPDFFAYLDTCMNALLEAKLSSPHGHETT
jgi:tetraacyldisaccharide 4'-kinase